MYTVHILFISMYLYRMSFKMRLLKLFFPNFMGMLCNKDADVKNACVSGNVSCHRESKRTVEKKFNPKIVCPKLKIGDPRAIIQIQELMRREGKTVPSSILMVCAHSGITQRASTIDMIIFWFYLFRKHYIKAIYPPGLCFFIRLAAVISSGFPQTLMRF